MQEINADFHLHGPRSIGVSKNMDLPNLVNGARQKGLQLVATGDCLQPDWLKHLKENLEEKNGEFLYKGINFVLQTEVEDKESVHEIILLPDFNSIDCMKKKFRPHSKNLDHEWGGRPRVNLPCAEIVEAVMDCGGLVGPAHVFTPFKSVFRQGKFDGLEDAYGSQAKNVHFLELGLSANSNYADRIKELHRVTFMSNSDAHAPSPASLGREFNTFEADSSTFNEVADAIMRKNGRKFTRNVGFDPKLGKYNVLFCRSCRKRVLVDIDPKEINLLGNTKITDEFIKVKLSSENEYKKYLQSVNSGKIICPSCQREKKKSKIKLGVSERVKVLADLPEGKHPEHRPPYLNSVPLTEILRVAMGIKSSSSKTLQRIYNDIVDKHGTEINVLIKLDHGKLAKDALQEKYGRYPNLFNTLGEIIKTFREEKISFNPGGGGTFGSLLFEA
ncbi:MAG: endonuclease Q family protein [Candidatus Hodarchaeota archaeon]